MGRRVRIRVHISTTELAVASSAGRICLNYYYQCQDSSSSRGRGLRGEEDSAITVPCLAAHASFLATMGIIIISRLLLLLLVPVTIIIIIISLLQLLRVLFREADLVLLPESHVELELGLEIPDHHHRNAVHVLPPAAH